MATHVPPTKSQKGAIFEWAVANLTMYLSAGELQMARLPVDHDDVDRVLVRTGGARKAAFLQMKSRAAPVRHGEIRLHFPPIPRSRARGGLYLLAGELLDHSPWVGPRFGLVPAPDLPAPSRSGQVSVRLPLKRTSKSKWARYVHDRADMATVLSALLDGGPRYPFPPEGGLEAHVRRLSPRARGHLVEGELAAAITYHGGRALHVWSPLVDDYGMDFAVTDGKHQAAVRLQPKGAFKVDRHGNIAVRVPKRTFSGRPFDFFVFGRYIPEEASLHPWAHVVRGDELQDLAERSGSAFMFRARPDPEADDAWRPWLYRVDELPGVLATAIEQRRAGHGRLAACREDVLEARRRMGLMTAGLEERREQGSPERAAGRGRGSERRVRRRG